MDQMDQQKPDARPRCGRAAAASARRPFFIRKFVVDVISPEAIPADLLACLDARGGQEEAIVRPQPQARIGHEEAAERLRRAGRDPGAIFEELAARADDRPRVLIPTAFARAVAAALSIRAAALPGSDLEAKLSAAMVYCAIRHGIGQLPRDSYVHLAALAGHRKPDAVVEAAIVAIVREALEAGADRGATPEDPCVLVLPSLESVP